MNEKEITRLACIRAIHNLFDGVQDDDHALFVYETMDEFPQDQRVSAIDVNGAHAKWIYKTCPLHMFVSALNAQVSIEANRIKLNMLGNTLLGA